MSTEAYQAVLDADLGDPTLKNVLLGMANHAGPTGEHCYPSVRRLQAYSNLGRSTIKNKLRDARKRGLLEVVKRASQHKPTEYRMNLPALQQLRHPLILELEEQAAIYGGSQGSSSKPPEKRQGSSSERQGSSSEPQGSSSGTRTVINRNKPATSRTANGRPPKSEQDRLRKIAEQTFVKATGLDPPDPTNDAARREAGTLWWSPLRWVVEWSTWDELKIERNINEAVFRMVSSELTISSPKSILNTCRAIKGEENTGRYKAQRPSAGSDAEFLQDLRSDE